MINFSSDFILKTILLSGFLAFFLAQFFIQYSYFFRNILLCFFLLSMPFFLYFNKRGKDFILMCVVFSLCIFLICLGSLLGVYQPLKNITFVYFYFSIMFAYYFSIDISFFFRMIKVFLLFNMLAMMYEFFIGGYILIPTSDISQFIGRAKGFFSYSKEAGAFVLVFSILFISKLSYSWFLVLIISSVLSGSRMAMIFTLCVVVIEVLRRFTQGKKITFSQVLFFLLVLFLVLFFVDFYMSLNESQIIRNRLLGTFDVGHSSNIERIGFWLDYISIYSDFGFLGLLFGQPGKAGLIVGNGAESAWLNLLTDGGIFSWLFYFFGMLIIFKKTKLSFFEILKLLILILSMQISRVALGFVDGVLFWTVVWSIFRGTDGR